MAELLDHAPCGFISFGDDSKVTLANATLLERLGYARDELVGRHFETVLTIAGKIFHQTHLFPLVKMHGVAREIFLLMRGKTGEDIGMLCNIARHTRNDVVAYDCVLMEVRERRKFEDALVQAKQAAERANSALESRSLDLELANQQLESQALELELQHQQLQEQAVELEMQSDRLQALYEDLQQHAEELQRQRATADEANAAKSNFLAVMSHELRTPLNAIAGYAELLEMGVHGPVSDAQREALGRIIRSQRHLLRLINDILNLSRIEAGHVDYSLEVNVLAEVVASVIPMVEPQIASRALRLEVEVPADLRVLADRDKLQQVLLNLLTNASKFTSAGGCVRVEAEDSADRSTVLLRVIDTGVGIPANMLEKVFEPFIQVDASRTRATEGTGLGLAISRDLARGMQGDLSATSTLGVGSTFTLTLPRA